MPQAIRDGVRAVIRFGKDGSAVVYVFYPEGNQPVIYEVTDRAGFIAVKPNGAIAVAAPDSQSLLWKGH